MLSAAKKILLTLFATPSFFIRRLFVFATGIITTVIVLIYRYMTTQHGYLLLADISGYTSFVVETEPDHYFKYDQRLRDAARLAGEEFTRSSPVDTRSNPVDPSLNLE